MNSVLRDPSRVLPAVATILASMLEDPRPGYAHPARAALRALEQQTLIAIQSTSTRYWIPLHDPAALPAPAPAGAIFQCRCRSWPPRSELDMLGWIVVQDRYASGPLVLVHELGHFLNRFVVWQRSQQDTGLVDRSIAAGVGAEVARTVRARLLDEIAARHLAWLAEQARIPGITAMPEPGALLACAVKIASYPEVYGDTILMPRLLARSAPGLLRDQVCAWMSGLRGFRFFDPDSEVALHHTRWLDSEIELAASGHAPFVDPEGTL